MSASRFVQNARLQVGKDYVWGTQGPDTFDCSGLVAYCYRLTTGKTISAGSDAQWTLGRRLGPNEKPQAGDLAFWDTLRNGTYGHVGIVTERGTVVNALNEDEGVVEGDLYGSYGGPLVGFRRLDLGKATAETQNQIPGKVTPQTGFRDAGNTDRESFRRALARTVTPGVVPPPLAEADDIYDELFPQGLTRLAAGMGWIERSNETNDADLVYYGRELHNLWAVKNQNGGWARYRNYKEAAREWRMRILGQTYADLETIAEFIGRYAPWSDGNDPTQYGQKLANQISALPLLATEPTTPTTPSPSQPSQDFKTWTIPGLGNIRLPKYITVEIDLTPIGVHRPGRVVQITGSTQHETGNRGNGSGARMHSNWQDGCTQGHPDGYVGVTSYIENRLIIVKIPLNESSIHSGDWRNNAHPSCELCVNADRNAEQSEDTMMWWQAAILHAKGQNAKDHLYPHHASGCPAIINAQGRWPQIEKGVDDRIAILKNGGSIPQPEKYAEVDKIPKTWDGMDYVRADGHRFVALSRVFTTTKVTAARKYADPKSDKVRKDLPQGEAFLSHYATLGSDGKAWLVSQFHSRILADDCEPRLDALDLVDDSPPVRRMGFVAMSGPLPDNDPTMGLSAVKVPDDAPAMSKAEFMRSGKERTREIRPNKKGYQA